MTTYSSAPPILSDFVHVSGTPGHLRLDLSFSTGMARGSGSIFITDGAAQTVIDRATGLPAMRIVGATVTREVPVSSVTIDGSHVYIDGLDLPAGHSFSVLMGPGVLQSSSQFAFAGISSPGRTSFSLSNLDMIAPTIVSTWFDPALNAGNSGTMSVTFSEAVPTLDAAAFTTPNAVITNLHAVDAGHLTWQATVTAAAGVQGVNNAASLDMTQVKDAAGNAGTGTPNVGTYFVDSVIPTLPKIAFSGTSPVMGKSASATLTFSEPVSLSLDALSATYANITSLNTSDGVTWTVGLSPQSGVTQTGNLSINLARVQDMAGNPGAGIATSGPYTVDTQGPSVASIALDGTAISPTHGVTLTITFSEAVKDPSAAIMAPHAKFSTPHSSDGLTWTTTLTPATTDTGNNLVTIDVSKVVDLNDNAGMGTVNSSTGYTVDAGGTPSGLAASVTLDGSQLAWGGLLMGTITFSEAVGTPSAMAISAPNATIEHLHGSEDGKTWYFSLGPSTTGLLDTTNIVTVDLAQVHTSAGAAGAGTASSANYTVDTTVTTLVSPALVIDDTGVDKADFVTRDAATMIGGDVIGTLGADQTIRVLIDGVAADPSKIVIDRTGARTPGSPLWNYVGGNLADGEHKIEASVVDGNGHASAAVTQYITVDTRSPVLHSDADNATALDVTQPIVIRFDETVYWQPSSTAGVEDRVELVDSAGTSTWVSVDSTKLSADGMTLTLAAADLHLAAGMGYTLYLPDTLTDLAGNWPAEHPITFHTAGGGSSTAAPHATGAVMHTSPGSYGAEAAIEITVVFDAPVQVKGTATPALVLTNGGRAVYDSISADGTRVSFKYMVRVDDGNGVLGLSSASELLSGFEDQNHTALASVDFTSVTSIETITIDTVAPTSPSTPALLASDDTGTPGDFITNKSQVQLSGAHAEAGAGIDIYDGMHLVGHGTVDTQGNWSVSASLGSDGQHALTAVLTDAAGNQSPASTALSVTLDSTIQAPSQPALAEASDTGSIGDLITSESTPTIGAGGCEPGASITIYDGETLLATVNANASGIWTYTTATLTDGQHRLSVHQTDIAGNVSTGSLVSTLTIDTVAPAALAAPTLDAASDSGVSSTDNITNVKKPYIVGSSAEANAKIELFDGDVLVASGSADKDGNWKLAPTADLSDGEHRFSVRQTDAAGNVGVKSEAIVVHIDTVAPTITGYTSNVISPGKFQIYFSELVKFTGTSGVAYISDGVSTLPVDLTLGSNWAEVTQGDQLVSAFQTMPAASGWVDVPLTGVQDLAGNAMTIPSAHYNFTFTIPTAINLLPMLYL